MPVAAVRQRVRARFSKHGDLRFLGHHDIARTIERLLRRVGVKLSRTEGFHPRPRISFPLALAVGIAGDEEVAEFELAEEVDCARLQQMLAEKSIDGLRITSLALVPVGERKAVVESIEFQMPLPPDRRADAVTSVAAFLAVGQWLIRRPGRKAPLDLRGDVTALVVDDQGLRIRLAVSHEATARPREVLAALRLDDLEQEGYYLTRTAVCLRGDAATPVATLSNITEGPRFRGPQTARKEPHHEAGNAD